MLATEASRGTEIPAPCARNQKMPEPTKVIEVFKFAVLSRV